MKIVNATGEILYMRLSLSGDVVVITKERGLNAMRIPEAR